MPGDESILVNKVRFCPRKAHTSVEELDIHR